MHSSIGKIKILPRPLSPSFCATLVIAFIESRFKRAEDARLNDEQRWLKAYKKSPEFTKYSIYLETMADVYPKIKQKIILDKDLEGILPLLPLGKEAK